jgi:hypothetical protein
MCLGGGSIAKRKTSSCHPNYTYSFLYETRLSGRASRDGKCVFFSCRGAICNRKMFSNRFMLWGRDGVRYQHMQSACMHGSVQLGWLLVVGWGDVGEREFRYGGFFGGEPRTLNNGRDGAEVEP